MKFADPKCSPDCHDLQLMLARALKAEAERDELRESVKLSGFEALAKMFRERLAAAEKVVEAARVYSQDPEACMVPIGGGNPYYHCKHCGVTNVEINMGINSRKHERWCDYHDAYELDAALVAYDDATKGEAT